MKLQQQVVHSTDQYKSVCHLAESKIRQSSMRSTAARRDVLTLLLLSQRAMSHMELQEALQDMDRVTLYRALDSLTEAKLTHKVTGDDRVFRYSTGTENFLPPESASIPHQHGHFKCTRCQKVVCLDQPQISTSLKEQLQATLEATANKGFQNHDIEVTIKGWCDSCS
jgi:Fur family ferric uptake transcriptional regulator